MNENIITSFSMDWFDCGCSCAEDVLHERVTVYLRKHIIDIKEYNGRDELRNTANVSVNKQDSDELFQLLQRMNWKTDYSVAVCDGFCWKLRIRYSDRTIRLVEGTVESPRNIKIIQKAIKEMLFKSRYCNNLRILG